MGHSRSNSQSVYDSNQQVGRDALRLAHDGFIGREVPIGSHVHIDAMLAYSHRQLLELLAARGLDFALPGLEIDLAAAQRLRVQRCRDVVEQCELRAQSLGDLRGFVDRGQRASRGILDGHEDAADGLHAARVAQRWPHRIGKIT
jgi:hypothetical protein